MLAELSAGAVCWVAICSLSRWWLGFLTRHQASSKCAFKDTGNGLALERAQLHFFRLLLLRQSYDSDSRIGDTRFTSWRDKVFWKPCFEMSIELSDLFLKLLLPTIFLHSHAHVAIWKIADFPRPASNITPSKDIFVRTFLSCCFYRKPPA